MTNQVLLLGEKGHWQIHRIVKNASSLLGKPAPKKRKLKSVPCLSQLIFFQIAQLHVTEVNVVQLHVAEVNVVFHGKLGKKACVRPCRLGCTTTGRAAGGARGLTAEEQGGF